MTLVLAALGFLSPAARGALLTAGMLFFVLLAGVSGFVAVYVWGLMERSINGWQVRQGALLITSWRNSETLARPRAICSGGIKS